MYNLFLYDIVGSHRDHYVYIFFFFQAEDGIRDLVRSRGLGDVYKRQKEGISAEVIDLRTIRPLDHQTIINSVKKTNRVVVLSLIHI